MDPLKVEETVQAQETNLIKNNVTQISRTKSLYKAVWRWHFYAGLLISPIVILLSISGALYLFKPQVEAFMYKDLYYLQEGQQGQQKVSASLQMEEVTKKYPDTKITSYKPSFEANRTTEIGISKNDENLTIFVNPYNGDIVGDLDTDNTLMTKFKDIHNGQLWGGVVGNRIVELVACWTIIMMITGAYLWWPRNKKSLFGTLIPRIRMLKGKRVFWRDIHSVTGFWLSLFIVILLFSGLMWTDVWGSMAHRVVDPISGSPQGDQPWEKHAFPKSTIPTKEIADVPWAAENMPVPESKSNGLESISVEKVMQIAKNENVHSGYKIAFPEEKTGVYTIFLDPADVYPNRPMPWAQQTLHIDQYNGEVLANLGWKDYGPLAKLISLSISFHQGEFGLVSQIFMLILIIGIMMITLTGYVMWWKRRPKGELGAPSMPENFKLQKGVAVIVIGLGIFFPLVGLSLIVVWFFDRLIIKKIKKVRQ